MERKDIPIMRPKRLSLYATINIKHDYHSSKQLHTQYDDEYRELKFFIIPTITIDYYNTNSLVGVSYKSVQLSFRFLVFTISLVLTKTKRRDANK